MNERSNKQFNVCQILVQYILGGIKRGTFLSLRPKHWTTFQGPVVRKQINLSRIRVNFVFQDCLFVMKRFADY